MNFTDVLCSFLAIFLITFLPLTTIYFVFYEWLVFIDKTYILIPYLLSIISIHYNYWLCFSTKAHYINSNTLQPLENPIYPRVVELKSTGNRRFCKHCRKEKPPRSHHCSECKTCILKMDHHCIVGHCVGHQNYPYFYRFLLSVTFATFYALLLLATRLYGLVKFQQYLQLHQFRDNLNYNNAATNRALDDYAYYYTKYQTQLELIFLVIDGFILVVVFLGVGILFTWQTVYILKGESTIESFENETIKEICTAEVDDDEIVFPYDLGYFNNFKSIFGDNVFLWPFVGAQGTGLEFPINQKSINNSTDTLVYWPPETYLDYKLGRYGGKSGPVNAEQDLDEYVKVRPIAGRRKLVRRGSEGYEVHHDLSDGELSDDECSFLGSEDDEDLETLKDRMKKDL